MPGVLSFSQFVGGPDNVIVEQVFPSNQRTLLYNFNQDITGWVFSADHQTLIVDEVQFSRQGTPNFSKSTVIGFFPKVDLSAPYAPEVTDAGLGRVKVHFPANMYQGPILPDARKNVPVTIFSLTWSDNQSPVQTTSHRWALVQNFEPDVVPGDPITDVNYTALGA